MDFKEDFLEDFNYLSSEVSLLKESLFEIYKILDKIKRDVDVLNTTDKKENKTPFDENTTMNPLFKPLKDQNEGISIGNQGASTDRQTDRQTDKKGLFTSNLTQIDQAKEILDSLDYLKKEIRLKFKRLTFKEMLVFSAIYQLEDEKGYADYKSLSVKLKLTESSIRDYVGRLLLKQIPLEKVRINNKEIHLQISQNLREIASLDAILKLKEI